MSRYVSGEFQVFDFRRDKEIEHVMEDFGAAAEESIKKLLTSAGVVKPGVARKAILESLQNCFKDVGLIPELRIEPDLLDETILHVVAGFRMVKIEPKPVVCEQCGGSKIDIGFDDMGTPVEGPCRKCVK